MEKWIAIQILSDRIDKNLISDYYLMRDVIWNTIYPNMDYVHFPYFHWIVKIVVVFIICTLIDKAREYISDEG